jgi:arsenate reductase (thioredoxin)
MKSVLFLCTGNACRSQMAEGWARHLRADDFISHSAGVAPHGVDPRAVRVMAEAGVDISAHRSKHVDELLDTPLDLVVTVCDAAAEACPVFPRPVPKLHRSFEDPPALARASPDEETALAHYRRVRDEIRAFVESLEA